jgi:acetylornithine deacetylase
VLDTLAQLIRINSVNPNYQHGVPEAEIGEFVEHFFRHRNIETWRQTVYPGRPNIIAQVPGRDPDRRIVFEAHLDTVSVSGMTIDPWDPVVRDGKMFGRGACDTKGGMAAMMHAVASLVADGITPACDVVFAATIDEEFSYRGVVALCDSLQPGPADPAVLEVNRPTRDPLCADAAIVAEPTELKPVIASKGVVRWKIETRGKAAHSSKPHLGTNAIEAMARIVSAIAEHADELSAQTHPLLGPATCNIGTIRGGTQVNFVPDQCEIEIDRRLLPGESWQSAVERVRLCLEPVARQHPQVEIVVHPPSLTDQPLETQAQSRAVQTMLKVLRDRRHEATPLGVPFGSDASKFGEIEIPAMIMGPGSIDQAHTADEFVDCQQVVEAAEIYRQFMIEFE